MAFAERVSRVSYFSGSDGEAFGDGSGGRPCPICEEPMYARHCKYVCPNHGVVFDCSDTFY